MKIMSEEKPHRPSDEGLCFRLEDEWDNLESWEDGPSPGLLEMGRERRARKEAARSTESAAPNSSGPAAGSSPRPADKVQYDFKTAHERGHLKTYNLEFYNAALGTITTLHISAVGLASVEYKEKDREGCEYVLLMDNGQFVHVAIDSNNAGTYYVADSLNEMREMYICLKEEAQQGLEIKGLVPDSY